MKRILALTALFLFAAMAEAQVTNPSVRYVAVAPSGACSQSPPVQVVNSSGAIYTCNNGTWAIAGGSGSGTVSTVSVVSVNGVSGSVANPTTTPAISLTLGAITPSSVTTSTVVASTSLQAGTTVIASGQGIWTRRGSTTWEYATAESTVWREGNCLSLTWLQTCFKRTYSLGSDIYYQESADGLYWPGVGVSTGVHQRPSRVIKSGGIYYMYAAGGLTPANSIDEFTSTNGRDYTLAHAGVITPAMVPDGWGATTTLDNSSGIMVGSTLYLAVDGNSGMGMNSGLWSSTDFHTFTPVADIIQGCSVRSPFYQFNGAWYTWVHCADQQIHRYTSASLTAASWTDALGGTPDLSNQTLNEGAGQALGQYQVADPFVLQVTTPTGLKTFIYYTATQGLTVNTPDEPWIQQTKLAIADMPVSSVVQTNGGDDTSQLDTLINLPINFDYYHRALDFQDFSLQNINGILFGASTNGENDVTLSYPLVIKAASGTTTLNVTGQSGPGILNVNDGSGISYGIYVNGAGAYLTGSAGQNYRSGTGTHIFQVGAGNTQIFQIAPFGVGFYGSSPTASSFGGGTAAGTNNAFQVTGISSATACTVTFTAEIHYGYCTANGAVGLVTVPTGTHTSSITFGMTVAETTITGICF